MRTSCSQADGHPVWEPRTAIGLGQIWCFALQQLQSKCPPQLYRNLTVSLWSACSGDTFQSTEILVLDFYWWWFYSFLPDITKIKSQNYRLAWLGEYFKTHPFPTPALSRAAPNQLRLPRAPCTPALSTSRNGAPTALWAAFPAPQHWVKNFFLTRNLNFPSV